MSRRLSTVATVAFLASGCATTSPLYKAAQEGDVAEVNRQLAAGAAVDARGPDDATPLAVAARRGNREIVAALVSHGADVKARGGADGYTALHVAAGWRRKEVVELLLASGADVSARAKHGETPLHIAILQLVPDVPYHRSTSPAARNALPRAGASSRRPRTHFVDISPWLVSRPST